MDKYYSTKVMVRNGKAYLSSSCVSCTCVRLSSIVYLAFELMDASLFSRLIRRLSEHDRDFISISSLSWHGYRLGQVMAIRPITITITIYGRFLRLEGQIIDDIANIR